MRASPLRCKGETLRASGGSWPIEGPIVKTNTDTTDRELNQETVKSKDTFKKLTGILAQRLTERLVGGESESAPSGASIVNCAMEFIISTCVRCVSKKPGVSKTIPVTLEDKDVEEAAPPQDRASLEWHVPAPRSTVKLHFSTSSVTELEESPVLNCSLPQIVLPEVLLPTPVKPSRPIVRFLASHGSIKATMKSKTIKFTLRKMVASLRNENMRVKVRARCLVSTDSRRLLSRGL